MNENFYKLYDWVLCRDDLTSSDKIVLALIQALSSHTGHCKVGDNYLAKKLNVTTRRVRTILKKLEDKGLIIRDFLDGKRVIIPVEQEYIH